MSEVQEPPYGVESWLAYLSDKPLSVRNSVQVRLRKLLRSDSATLADFSQLISCDPVLALAVVREAANRHQAKGSQVTGLGHAVQSLGIVNLQQAVEQLPAMKLNPASVAQKMYFRAIANSHHAATQAQQLARRKHSMFSEETYLAALFYGVGHWSLWLHAPLHMSKIQGKIRDQGIDNVLAETDVLGCTVQQISKALIEHWQVSPLAGESLDHDTSPDRSMLRLLHLRAMNDPRLDDEDIRDTNHLVQQKFFPVKLANWLALTAPLGWAHSKTLRIVDIVNDYLKDELDQTAALLHQQCAQSARQYHVPGTLTPAAEMLLLPSDCRGQYLLSAKETQLHSQSCPEPVKPNWVLEAEKAKAAAAALKAGKREAQADKPAGAELSDANIYGQTAQRFLKGYDLYTEPRHILQGLLQGLHKGLGVDRVLFHRVKGDKQQLNIASAIGLSEDSPAKAFAHDLEVPSLFKRLIKKPSCIWLNSDNRDKLIRMLPDDYHPLVPNDGVLLMSLFLNNRPIGIVHIDSPSNGAPLQQFHQERFRYLCSAASLALRRMTKG
ncbi:HDOD domain-containing protein [Marinobacterium arenosum]|uniref:HDOD domain-containing protein n=1 Tax=Marinobacterium arenosum TaxID=2862496 RepID=UPI001C938A26|nr:HDOD domain-containing protein [Marinobacterium arenosum]MBY4677048.1 HDOD domain-containing protein [Marinobacterium arenosum]